MDKAPIKIGEKVITGKLSHCLSSVSNGNTSKRDTKLTRNRGRSWCFTLNNYTEEDVVLLSHNKWDNMEIDKYVFQEELGENKTPHLQGVIQFKNQVSFTSLKEFHNKIRWSRCKNLKASIKYCSKQNTRNGAIYKYGEIEKWLWKDRSLAVIDLKKILEDMCRQMKDEPLDMGDLKLDM